MRLLRVQVPEFRALKDVDISFEPEFTPQVFPLGSLNGGGKSTLLQLIFILLHCSAHKERHQFIVNMLDRVKVSEEKSTKLLAKFELLDNKKKFELEFFICNSNAIKNNGFLITHVRNFSLMCSVSNLEINDNTTYNVILEKISSHVFLLSPSSEIYLFLPRKDKQLLFSLDSKISYTQALQEVTHSLPNFFTDNSTKIYDLAKDNNFNEKDYYQLERKINTLLTDDKKIIPIKINDDAQVIRFKLTSGVEIYLEDLSQGELNRLAILVLLKYHKIQDSILLVDEIESSFHPNWQRYIVDDLVDWEVSNQYILSTHSYELCRGVSISHIKEVAA